MINDNGELIITWCIKDIICLAQDREYPTTPTREQATEVLEMADKYHDANIGINWDVLSVYLDQIIDSEE